MRSTLRLVAVLLACAISAILAIAQEDPLATMGKGAASLAVEASDRTLSIDRRDRALSALSYTDFDRAVQLAPSLVGEEDEGLRFRAAWILAEAGRSQGIDVLRAMASDTNSSLTLAPEALGRLRDSKSHQLLRDLLEAELSRPDWRKARPRVAAMAAGLSDYADPRDAALLARAVSQYWDSGVSWVDVEYLGRTGGREAIPVLHEVFAGRGKGWAVMAAGLGLARCGSEIGKAYVADRLSDPSGGRYPEGRLQDDVKDDPKGPRATDYILTRLGVPSDVPFVPLVLGIAANPLQAAEVRGRAWNALVRINSVKHRDEVLALAWKDGASDGAARFIAMNDEVRARAELTRARQTGSSPSAKRVSAALETALAANARERRRWRESRGYGF